MGKFFAAVLADPEVKPLLSSEHILRLPEKPLGPLYLGFNMVARPVRVQSLLMTGAGGRIG